MAESEALDESSRLRILFQNALDQLTSSDKRVLNHSEAKIHKKSVLSYYGGVSSRLSMFSLHFAAAGFADLALRSGVMDI